MLRLLFFALCVVSGFCFGVEHVRIGVISDLDWENDRLNPQDSLPGQHLKGASDTFLQGYIQALLDVHYHELGVKVKIENHIITLEGLPDNEMLSRSIQSFVRDITGVHEVERTPNPTKQEEPEKKDFAIGNILALRKATGVWMPQTTVLFPPLVADPRQVNHSVGYRFYDQAIGKFVFAMSVGEHFPIYRWQGVSLMGYPCDMQVSVEPGVWSVFDTDSNSFPLINTDFSVGVPLTFALGKWSYRFRVYHFSTHLGDEFIVRNPTLRRRNVSAEVVDLFASYQLTQDMRVYFGLGDVFHSDRDFHIQPLHFEYGTELRLLGERQPNSGLHIQPFMAMHFRSWEDKHWEKDATFQIGLEWSKIQGVGRKTRTFFEYHDGFSLEGQFARQRTEYFAFRLTYGF